MGVAALIHSMTGFARLRFTVGDAELLAEIKTLNHKTLDLHCRLPEGLAPIEIPLRRLVQKYISRGRVDLRISTEHGGAGQIELNRPVYESYLNILAAISTAAPADYDPVALLSLPNILVSVSPESEPEAIWGPLAQVLAQLKSDRQREGALLWQDILARAHCLQELIRQLEALAAVQGQEVGARLRQRLAQFDGLDESRLLTDIALLIDKCDINEELVRFKAHLAELVNCSNRPEPVGRRLEFIGQELLREANTIGAKSAVYPVSKLAVEIKTELEKIREQVQNIE